MPIIKISSARVEEVFQDWFRAHAPKILVVTDKLSFEAGDNLGLTEFVATLRASTIHGMRPRVVTALFDPAGTASFDVHRQHIDGFKFTDPEHGLSRAHHDVVFMLADNRIAPGETQLTDEIGALEAVTAFMQAGGGLFATGDHEDLGAGMCAHIPRVRSMRRWKLGDTPSAGGADRLTTILPGRGDLTGSNDVYELSDQSDGIPQRLFVNFLTEAARPPFVPIQRLAHPLLQVGAARAIEVFPDHANEGECVIPKDLDATLRGGDREWPFEIGHLPAVSPEMVALGMSSGNGIGATGLIPPRQAVVPRSFIAIAAYDGHRCNVGRVVTDSSYHHFVNANVSPDMATLGERDLLDIKRYYENLATWLMPQSERRRRRHAWLVGELSRYPARHEFPSTSGAPLEGARAHELGVLVEEVLLARHNPSVVHELMSDALDDAIGPAARRELESVGATFGRVSARDAALAALGALALATAEGCNRLALDSHPALDADVERAFADTEKASAGGAKLYLATVRGQLPRLGELLDSIIG